MSIKYTYYHIVLFISSLIIDNLINIFLINIDDFVSECFRSLPTRDNSVRENKMMVLKTFLGAFWIVFLYANYPK